MISRINMDEARGVCKDRSRWCSVVSAYPHGKKKTREFMYVCINSLGAKFHRDWFNLFHYLTV